MTDALDQLVSLLDLQRIDGTTFQGASLDIGTNRVYGGQVLGQALKAAQMTVGEGKIIHSMHAYFLREGDYQIPITYKVDITRDGRSFSTRSIAAIQYDKPIFIAVTSFHLKEAGPEYQPSMPEVVGPDSLKSLSEYDAAGRAGLSDKLHNLLRLSAPFDMKPVVGHATGNTNELHQLVWIKTIRPIPDDSDLHRAVLAYISDYGLVTTTLLPHKLEMGNPLLQLASIDHGMWFHRPFRADEWLLYACEPVTTCNARGLARGSLYNRNGILVATTIQEGLLRKLKQ